MKKKLAAVLLALSMLSAPAVFNEAADAPLGINAEAASTKLAKPKNFKAKVTGKKVKLSWKKVSGAEAYAVYRYDATKEKYVKVKTTTNNSLTLKVESYGTYKFRVYSLDKVNGKYKKGKYATKTVKVVQDMFQKQFKDVEFGMDYDDVVDTIDGDDYLAMDNMILEEINDDEYAIYMFEDDELLYYGFAYPYSEKQFEKCCDYYDDAGWTSFGDEFDGSSMGIGYGAEVFIKNSQFAMVIEMEELDLIFSVLFELDTDTGSLYL